MDAKPLKIIKEKEFWKIEKTFSKMHREKEGDLSMDQQVANYERFYDTLIKHLRLVGSHEEDRDTGLDFSTSRHVDPAYVTVVVSGSETVFRSGALDAALNAINETGGNHMVIFDTGSYIGILPDGRVIGYSEFEELHELEKLRIG